jgi:hypothetical protein
MKPTMMLTAVLLLAGCVRVEYLDYRGVQAWPTGSAFVQAIDGVDVFEGLPDRVYEVIGLIDVYDDKPFYHDDSTRSKVVKIAKEHKADAIVWLSDRTVTSGGMKMGAESKDPASLDTGRSSQPEMVVTNVSQYTATSYKKSLRSSLLLVRWK